MNIFIAEHFVSTKFLLVSRASCITAVFAGVYSKGLRNRPAKIRLKFQLKINWNMNLFHLGCSYKKKEMKKERTNKQKDERNRLNEDIQTNYRCAWWKVCVGGGGEWAIKFLIGSTINRL